MRPIHEDFEFSIFQTASMIKELNRLVSSDCLRQYVARLKILSLTSSVTNVFPS